MKRALVLAALAASLAAGTAAQASTSGTSGSPGTCIHTSPTTVRGVAVVKYHEICIVIRPCGLP